VPGTITAVAAAAEDAYDDEGGRRYLPVGISGKHRQLPDAVETIPRHLQGERREVVGTNLANHGWKFRDRRRQQARRQRPRSARSDKQSRYGDAYAVPFTG